MEWIKEKLEHLGYVFDEYPKVYWCSIFYMAIAAIALIGYFPLLKGIASLNILGTQPFQQLIVENLNWLRWGLIAVPVLILFFGWCHAAELHERLMRRKYRF